MNLLVTRSDVSKSRRLTLDANKHTYGHWRNILSELNMDQLIYINDKKKIWNDAIFEGGLVTPL